MIFESHKTLAVLAMALSLVTVACSEDEKPKEVVQPTASEQPATPPEASSDAATEATKAVYFAFDDYSLNS